MQLFRDVIDECGFLDLGFFGTQFMWHKHFANGLWYGKGWIEVLQTMSGFFNLGGLEFTTFTLITLIIALYGLCRLG